MRILALETSGMSGSAATLTVGEAPQSLRLPLDQRSARGLAPTVGEVLRRAGWRPTDVQVVAVTVGPGSFTGLRIGITTAKLLAYAWKADLIAVDTLNVLARQAERDAVLASAPVLHALLDAHRRELFHAQFRRDAAGRWRRETDSHLIAVDDWLAAIRPGDAVIGPIVEKLSPQLPPQVLVASAEHHQPDAAAVAELAAELHAQGRRDDPFQIAPNYLRLAAAEEKRLRSG